MIARQIVIIKCRFIELVDPLLSDALLSSFLRGNANMRKSGSQQASTLFVNKRQFEGELL